MGNQFFQWVFALWLARDEVVTALDMTFIKQRSGNQARGELELLHLFPDLTLPVINQWRALSRFEPLLARLARMTGRLSGDCASNEAEQRQAKHHYGYYQDSRFFRELDENTRQWLKVCAAAPGAEPPDECKDIGAYAALHVRAGDYRLSAYNRDNLGLLRGAYYERALSQLREAAPQRDIIVVSDDFDSCRALMPRIESNPGVVYLDRISSRSGDPYTALQVLLHAEALSCANSSFSAMAAYLGRARHTVGPTPWFRAEILRHVAPQLPSWHRLKAEFE